MSKSSKNPISVNTRNNFFLSFRSIRTNWATRKPAAPGGNEADFSGGSGKPGGGGGPGGPPMNSSSKLLNYDEVFQSASSVNFTVYCGGITNSDENTIRAAFTPYGRIMEIRYFRDKGYAFIRYDNKESACSAIVAVNMTQIAGQQVKCSWGKESPQSGGPGGPGQPVPSGDYMPRQDMGGPGHGGYDQQPHFQPHPYHQHPQHHGYPPQHQQMYADMSQYHMMQAAPQPHYANYGYSGYGGDGRNNY